MMGKKVVLSSTAKAKLADLLEYLENKWSEKVKREFIERLDKSISRISDYPKSCSESIEIKGLFKCVVTRHTSLFYRIKEKEIEIITIFDTRQHPKMLKN